MYRNGEHKLKRLVFPLVYIVRKFEKEKEDKTMNYEKYVENYKRFLNKWQSVKERNENGDYSHGTAIYGASCDKVVVFDNDEQKQNYKTAYGF
jgi:hypothetical protein